MHNTDNHISGCPKRDSTTKPSAIPRQIRLQLGKGQAQEHSSTKAQKYHYSENCNATTTKYHILHAGSLTAPEREAQLRYSRKQIENKGGQPVM
jgi:hypothetical protein